MATINFGSEDEKIGLGFELFNTSGKSEMTLEDFSKSYETLVLNWSLLLGEKLQPDAKTVTEIFERLDREKHGSINKLEYHHSP
ncbi:MAG: hypothetical protein P4M11_14285 [Candidatus Pacebacteria bacterium]|nr:hypothetical protein [Candidatus Paceibacterota bacterium]